MKRYIPTTAELDHIKEYLEYRDGMVFWKVSMGNQTKFGYRAGCLHKHTGYRQIKIQGRPYLEHNIIWFLETGEWPLPDMDIDHIDRNKLNNDISNLREISHSDNNKNHGGHSHNTSGITGVSYDKTNDGWIAFWSEDKKLKRKSFACKKYSDAKGLAIAHRKRKVMGHY